jgi:hypothetical protein
MDDLLRNVWLQCETRTGRDNQPLAADMCIAHVSAATDPLFCTIMTTSPAIYGGMIGSARKLEVIGLLTIPCRGDRTCYRVLLAVHTGSN